MGKASRDTNGRQGERSAAATVRRGAPRLDEVAARWQLGTVPVAYLTAIAAVFRAERSLTRRAEEALKPLDLSLPRYETLAVLYFSSDGAVSLRELGRSLGVSPTTLGYVVDVLEKRGLAKRVADENDGRVILAQITGIGRAVMKEAMTLLEGVAFGLGSLSEDEASMLTGLLERLHSEPHS